VKAGIVVEAAPEASDDALFGEPGECLVHGGTGSEFLELTGDEYGAGSALLDLMPEFFVD